MPAGNSNKIITIFQGVVGHFLQLGKIVNGIIYVDSPRDKRLFSLADDYWSMAFRDVSRSL